MGGGYLIQCINVVKLVFFLLNLLSHRKLQILAPQ